MMMMMLMTMVLMMMMVMMVMTLMLMLMMMVVMMMIFHLRGASSSALATDRQVRLARPARGRCALAGRSRPGHLAGPGGGTLLRMDTLVVDDDGEGHIGSVHVVASAFLVQAVEHHLGKRHNSTTSSDFEYLGPHFPLRLLPAPLIQGGAALVVGCLQRSNLLSTSLTMDAAPHHFL